MVFTLVGMPGCGKSCMGRALSSRLKIRALDTDKMIERKYNKRLQELIDEQGNDGFGKIEEEMLLSIYDNPVNNVIISTGGSAIYYDKAMEHLKSLGKIVYLYCSYETIAQRLGDFSARGVVLKPGYTLRDLYEERTKLYEKYADYIINCDGRDYSVYQNKTARLIKNCIKRHKKQTENNNRG